MKGITLADIAKATGYSINTVSHALHDKPDISEKTKKLIVKMAEDMGYIANTSASALRSGKSRSVAIIVGDIANPHFSIMIKEMERRLREYNYNSLVLNTEEDEDLEKAAIVSAISKNVDGIILCPVQKTRNNLEFLKKCGVPYLFIGRCFQGDDSGYAVCDDFNGGYVAAQHLLELKHRKLLFIHAPLYISSAHLRLEGVKKAISDAGQGSLKTAQISPTDCAGDIKQILQKNTDCTGIICFSDMIAMQVCHFLKELGRSVPEDASVIGFDNIVSKMLFPLLLTSVTSAKTSMSTTAVDTLMDVIDGKTDSNLQYIHTTRVIKRESTKTLDLT